MLKRKIYDDIETFYKNKPHKALMITGARQVGKSYIIEHFSTSHYKHFIKIDFIENSSYVDVFQNARSAEDVLLRLSSLFGDDMVSGETMIFFDEVQECGELITMIKYLVQDGKYDYILSGSLLGTVFNDISSVPVGYMDVIRMYPMDFEEFARANGMGDRVFLTLKSSFDDRTPLDGFLHSRMMTMFELYMIVGGMPKVVSTYLETKNLRLVAREQEGIIGLYKKDISKYDREDKLYLNEIFDLIPSELNARNKRFILKNLNEKAKFAKYKNSFLWLANAGVALPVYVVDEPKTPLLMSKSSNLFKLFSSDVGLLNVQYGADMQLKILNHETNLNFGAIYENIAAQELQAHGYTLYFYNGKKFGELDFVIESGDKTIPIEIKSGKDYYRHNAMNNVIECSDYGIDEGYVFCNGNVETKEKVTYYPIYMLMFMKKDRILSDIICDMDFSDLGD